MSQFPEAGPPETTPGDVLTTDAEWFDGGWLYTASDQQFGYWLSDDVTTVRLYERTETDVDRRFRPVLETSLDDRA
jgi:hypothetical protein